MAPGRSKAPRVLDRHVVRPEMHAVGTRRKRDIDAVVDDERHVNGASAALIARPRRPSPRSFFLSRS